MTRRGAAAAGGGAGAAVLLLLWLLLRTGDGAGGTPSRGPPPPAPALPGRPPDPPAPLNGSESDTQPPPADAGGEPPPPPSAPEVPEEVCVLEGTVLDHLDRPVPGALLDWGILPAEDPDGRWWGPRSPLREPSPIPFAAVCTAVSGEDGAFRFSGPPRDRVLLRGRVEGGRIEPFGPFRLEGTRSGVLLRVAPAAAVEGVVLRPAPRGAPGEDPSFPPPPVPEPGARVLAWRPQPYGEGSEPLAEGATDAAGRFRLEGLPPGAFRITAGTGDGLSAETRLLQPGGEEVRLLLADPVPFRDDLEGVVLLPDGRTPAAGARVILREDPPRSGEGRLQATSAADGTFRFRGVPSCEPGKTALKTLEVDAGERGVALDSTRGWPGSGPVTVVLWPPAFRRIRGRAVEADAPGSPGLGGIPLRVRSWHLSPVDPRIRIEETAVVRTREDGTFRVERAGAEGAAFEVVAGESPWQVARALHQGDGEYLLEIVPASLLEGTVRTGTGEAVPGAACCWDGRNSVLADGEGRFRFFPVPGDRNLVVAARAAGWGEGRSLTVSVPKGGAVRDLVVVLDARVAVLSGRVLGEEGEAVAFARVMVSPSGRDPRGWETAPAAWADGDGRWRMEVPAAGGPWRVTGTAPGRRADFVDPVEEGRGIRDLRLAKEGAVK